MPVWKIPIKKDSNGIEYWGRQIPTLNRKPAKTFNEQEQEQFIYCGAMQLGRGHALSLQNIDEKNFKNHFNENYQQIVQATEQLKQELLYTWEYYRHCFKVYL